MSSCRRIRPAKWHPIMHQRWICVVYCHLQSKAEHSQNVSSGHQPKGYAIDFLFVMAPLLDSTDDFHLCVCGLEAQLPQVRFEFIQHGCPLNLTVNTTSLTHVNFVTTQPQQTKGCLKFLEVLRHLAPVIIFRNGWSAKFYSCEYLCECAPMCMYMYLCQKRPGEGIRSPGSGDTGFCVMTGGNVRN